MLDVVTYGLSICVVLALAVRIVTSGTPLAESPMSLPASQLEQKKNVVRRRIRHSLFVAYVKNSYHS